jgi:hypothetical protein
MRIAKPILLLFFLFTGTYSSRAQELQCNVVVNTDNYQVTDKSVFADMQSAIFEFMNTRRWTNDVFKNEERISCNLYINITGSQQLGSYDASVQIQSNRPVFGSGYSTPVLSFVDQQWTFEYAPGQPMNFAPSQFSSNLTSILAFYAYVIIGMDYDTFTKLGGTPYFNQAQAVVTMAQSQPYPGWQAYDSKNNRNRYWLVDNLLDPQIQPLREGIYNYHRLGLDRMTEKPEDARKVVTDVLKPIKKIIEVKPNSAFIRSFFAAKAEEIAGIFTQGSPQERQAAFNMMLELDPTNMQKYQPMVDNKNAASGGF